ncbi:MAG TPA: hypothetical protein VF231_05420 [Candidatus Limnocylindrales bacterium]
MSLPCGPDAAQTLEILAAVQRQLAVAVTRLTDVAARAVSVADQTDWRTDAAAVFHANAEAWRRDVANLASDVAGARAHVAQDCARIEGRFWWWGG